MRERKNGKILSGGGRAEAYINWPAFISSILDTNLPVQLKLLCNTNFLNLFLRLLLISDCGHWSQILIVSKWLQKEALVELLGLKTDAQMFPFRSNLLRVYDFKPDFEVRIKTTFLSKKRNWYVTY